MQTLMHNVTSIHSVTVRLVPSAEMAAVLYTPKRELKFYLNEQVQ